MSKLTYTQAELANHGNNSKHPQIIVADMDDTLCNSAQIYTYFLKALMEEYGLDKYLNLDKKHIYTAKEIYGRNSYYMENWLGNDLKMPDDKFELFKSIWNFPKFYEKVSPTKYALGLKKFLEKNLCQEIHVISITQSEELAMEKATWLYNFFGKNNKVKFYPVSNGTKKSDIIKKYKIEFNVYAEDSLDHIIDVCTALPTVAFGSEILIPNYGYNQPTEQFRKLAETLNLQVFYLTEI